MRMKKITFTAVLIFLFGLSNAQLQLQLNRDIRVYHESAELKNAWAGGFNTPQFSEMDVNQDGLKDLVVFERNFYGSVKIFINQGIQGEITYEYQPKYQSLFPALRNWMLLRDYDCDGLEDIFTSVPGGVAVYKGEVSNGKIDFVLQTGILLSQGPNGNAPLYVAPPDIPAIVDIDNDGDLDILSFEIIGNTLEYHKNLSMENYGNCNELEFVVNTSCWGYFSEDGNNNTVTLFDTCQNKGLVQNSRHAGSTVLAIDLFGNGLKDLLLGDITYPNLVMLKNGGSMDDAVMIDQQTDFPSNSQPVDLNVFPAAYYLDVNNDHLKDLLVAPNNPNTSENHDNVWYYENTGNSEIPEFSFIQNDFLETDIIDLGEASYPVFFDENVDGLMDIVAGSFGYFLGSGDYSSRLMLLRNIGSSEEPAFEIVSDDYAGLGIYGFEGVYPAFGDMDQDGDEDMIVGDEEGRLHLFTNQAGTGQPADFELTGPNFMDIDVSESAKPQIVDVNRDTLPDILVGVRGGTIRYYENTGSAENPEFSSVASNDRFGDVDVMPECCTGYSAPHMTTDSLNNSILYVGSEQGWIYLFNDIDGNLSGTFNLLDSLYLDGVKVNLNGADINADGKKEFVYGQFAGGLGMLKSGKPFVYGIGEKSSKQNHLKVFPNPARDIIRVDFKEGIKQGKVYLTIYTLQGLEMFKREYTLPDQLVLDVHFFKSGLYILQIQTETFVISEKVLIE